MLTAVIDSLYLVHIIPQNNFAPDSNFDVTAWVNTVIVGQKDSNLSLDKVVLDFSIATLFTPSLHNIHIGSNKEVTRYQTSIEKMAGFLCFKVCDVPVIPELDIKKATLTISLLDENYKNHFRTCIPFIGCVTHEEPLR